MTDRLFALIEQHSEDASSKNLLVNQVSAVDEHRKLYVHLGLAIPNFQNGVTILLAAGVHNAAEAAPFRVARSHVPKKKINPDWRRKMPSSHKSDLWLINYWSISTCPGYARDIHDIAGLQADFEVVRIHIGRRRVILHKQESPCGIEVGDHRPQRDPPARRSSLTETLEFGKMNNVAVARQMVAQR